MDAETATISKAIITEINGPVIKVKEASQLAMNELVVIGEERLLGEVVELYGEKAIIQVFEDTTGLKPGISVFGQGMPLFVELGPGIVGHIFDGAQRPLATVSTAASPFVTRGKREEALERTKPWSFKPLAQIGEHLQPGQIIGEVRETERVLHRVLNPPDKSGRVVQIVPEGLYTVAERIALLEDDRGKQHEVYLYHRWPVRKLRPYRERLLPS